MKTRILSLFLSYFNQSKSFVWQFLGRNKYWIFILISSYCSADLLTAGLRAAFFNEKPRSPQFRHRIAKVSSSEDYRLIWNFNIFHNGEMPPPLNEQSARNTLPQKSGLPLQLNGVIVYKNPLYSIANISIKNADRDTPSSESYHIGESVPEDSPSPMARITNITAKRVYFMNLNNDTEEYIEISDTLNLSFAFQKASPSVSVSDPNSGKDLKRTLSRSDINKYFRILPSILQEAKAVPYRQNGQTVGWILKYIKPDSVLATELGLKKSDIIVSVNGETPRSHIDATRLFHQMQTQSQFNVIVKRDGKDIALSYSVDENDSIGKPINSRLYSY